VERSAENLDAQWQVDCFPLSIRVDPKIATESEEGKQNTILDFAKWLSLGVLMIVKS
jgi:hypothetical protein